jgi:hypothetical protein
MTDPTTWPTVAEKRPPLGAKCNYFVAGNGLMCSDPAHTHWQLADGPAVQSREPASVAPEAKPLSPATQIVRDAAAKAQQGSCYIQFEQIAAATLRAAADQVVPIANYSVDSPWSVGFADRDAQLRRDLLAIAAELEGADG